MKRATWGLWITGASALCLAASFAVAGPKGKDPFVGTWQYDAAKATFTGAPAYKAGKVVISEHKGVFKVVADLTTADGRAVHTEYAGPTDGSDIKVSGNPMADSLTLLRPDRNTVIRTDRRGGKVVYVLTTTVAKDGKSYTGSGRGTTVDGHQFTSSAVWNRVK